MPPRPLLEGRLSKWILLRAVACLAAAYAVTVLVLLALEDRLVFHPVRASRRWADPPPGYRVEDVDLRDPAGARIHARWFPCAGAGGAVLVCHSRAGNLSIALRAAELAGWQREVGVSVLIFDYPGYGRSAGSPSEAGCYRAAEAAYDWLTRDRGVAPKDLLLFGRSLGTAVAVELASRRPHRALVLVSPLTSLPEVALSQFPLLPARQLMRNRFDSLSRIGRCRRPLFIVHGTGDRLVPFEQGKRLFAAAGGPRRLLPVEGARHGDSIRDGFFIALRRFLAEAEGGDGSPLAGPSRVIPAPDRRPR